MKSRWISILTLASVALLMWMAGSSYAAAQTQDSAQISQLLREAQTYAIQAERDATELESFTHSKLSWQTHAQQLDRIRENVNKLGKLHQQVTDMQEDGSPWQQEAIQQIDPVLREMADVLTTTIQHLSDNRAHIQFPQYQEYARANAELSSKMAHMISDYVAYDKAKSRAEALEKKLEMSKPAETE